MKQKYELILRLINLTINKTSFLNQKPKVKNQK